VTLVSGAEARHISREVADRRKVVWIVVGFASVWLVPFGAILNTLRHGGHDGGRRGSAGILVGLSGVK
jgi:hypothetical protein